MKAYFNFKVKAVDGAEGVLVGLAAVYGNIDRAQDVIAPGAFTKTLLDNANQVPLLYQHRQDQPIGLCSLTDTKAGLAVNAKLVLGAGVAEAETCWSLMRAGVIRGLSIGYDVLKSTRRGDVRVLEEIQLWEISCVTIACNPLAMVTGLKANREMGELAQFPQRLKALAVKLNLDSQAAMERELAATARRLTARLEHLAWKSRELTARLK